MFETGNQLKGYIQREVKNSKINSNYGYNYFFTRSFLKKLYEQSNIKFVLKGSYSQFTNLGKISRPITDIDIVSFNNLEVIDEQVNRIIKDDSSIKFKVANKFVTTNSTLNYKIFCDFNGKTGRISLDLKTEEIIDFNNKELPKLFSKDEIFNVNAISIEEHLASKIYTVLLNLKLYNMSSKEFRRFKDIYDIYNILGSNIIDSIKVNEIFGNMVKRDNLLTEFDLSGILFDKNFVINNEDKWLIEKKEYGFINDVSMSNAVEATNEYVSLSR